MTDLMTVRTIQGKIGHINCVCAKKKLSFCSYKIYRVQPDTDKQSKMLENLMDADDGAGLEVDVLFHSRDLDTPTEVMVKPEMQYHFESFLDEHDIDYDVTVDDLKR